MVQRYDRGDQGQDYEAAEGSGQGQPQRGTVHPYQPLHLSQMVIEEDLEGYTTFQLEVIVNPELERDLLAYGCGITVLSPQSLVESIRRHHKASLNP